MRMWVLCVAVVLGSAAASARETVREVSWSRLQAAGDLMAGKLLPADAEADFERLAVTNPGPEAATLTVMTLEAPPITSGHYTLAGRVRYEGVAGKGYLEMLSHFPGKGASFSRTLAAGGPMAALEGSSGWRRFVLPFRAKPGGPPPEKLVFNVVLPGRGTVTLGRVMLSQFDPDEDLLAAPGQWWGERTAGLVGGGLGALFGVLGGIVGWLGGRGRKRAVVLGILRSLTVTGAVCLAAGLAALLVGQPYVVYYPLMICGLIGTVVSIGVLPVVRRRYQEQELQAMAVQDAS